MNRPPPRSTLFPFATLFRSTTDGQEALTVLGSGLTTFGGAVGDNSQRLASLTSNAGGNTALKPGSVNATCVQNYNDAVTLDAPGKATTLTRGNITFASPNPS